MRFSLRVFLLAVAYVSLVTGTIISRNTALSTLVWWVMAIVACYAFVTLCFSSGVRRAMALGFLLMAATHFAVVYFAPPRTPAVQLFTSIGYVVSGNELYVATTAGDTEVPDSRAIVSAANASVTMLVGLLGCGIGALAYRHSSKE